MSTYRPARFGLAFGYVMPRVEFTANEIEKIYNAVSLEPCKLEDMKKQVFAEFLRDVVRWYFVWASQQKDEPGIHELREYATDLHKALKRLYKVLGADMQPGLIGGSGHHKPGETCQIRVFFHPLWHAHREFMALCAMPEMPKGMHFGHLWANVAPDMAPHWLTPPGIERFAALRVDQEQEVLCRALAGVDALAWIASAACKALKGQKKGKGHPPISTERKYLFGRMLSLYRQTYREEPTTRQTGEAKDKAPCYAGTWHEWLRVVLPILGDKLREHGLRPAQIPVHTWSEAPAHTWLKSKIKQDQPADSIVAKKKTPKVKKK
jgi:hypothetical protein